MAKKITVEDFLSQTKPGAVIKEDEVTCKLFKDHLNEKGVEKLFQTEYWNEFCELINSKKIDSIDLGYCFLANNGCGKFDENTFCSSSYTINGKYEDPDAISYKLYQFERQTLINKIEKSKEKFPVNKVSLSFKDYKFKLKLTYSNRANKEKEILLSGDWIGNKKIVQTSKDPYEAIKKLHTLAGHVFWPAEEVNRHNTVNMLRTDKLNIKDTLEVLKNCYLKDECATYLHQAFYDYIDYYYSFGEGENGFENYLDFWDIRAFKQKETDLSQEGDLSKERYRLIKKYPIFF